ncbi:MAG: hypothetical protein L0G87_15290 [Renibacterium salmoninarum]|nr:hypothetical protein [Renibacterium salmoninarum]
MTRGSGAQIHGFGAGSPAAQFGCASAGVESFRVCPAERGSDPQVQDVAFAGVATNSAMPAKQTTAPSAADLLSSFMEYPLENAVRHSPASA